MKTTNPTTTVQAQPENASNKETVRQWKDRMEVEHRHHYNLMVSQLGKIKTNCQFAVANADHEIRDFAQIILRIVNET